MKDAISSISFRLSKYSAMYSCENKNCGSCGPARRSKEVHTHPIYGIRIYSSETCAAILVYCSVRDGWVQNVDLNLDPPTGPPFGPLLDPFWTPSEPHLVPLMDPILEPNLDPHLDPISFFLENTGY